MTISFLVASKNNLPQFFTLANIFKPTGCNIKFIDLSSEELGSVIMSQGFDFERIIIQESRYYKIHKDNRIIHAAKGIENQIASDIYFLPYEFNFYFFFTIFAKKAGARVIHVQHALWGQGKFFEKYYQSFGVIEKEPLLSIIMRSIKTLPQIIRGILIRTDPEIIEAIELRRKLGNDEAAFPLSADYFLVPNEHYKNQVFSERPTYPQDRVVVSGILKYESFNRVYEKSELAERFQLDLYRKWAVYLYADFEQYDKRYSSSYGSMNALKDFLQVFDSQKSESQVVIIVHPKSKHKLSTIQSMLGDLGKALILSNEHFDFYRNSELIVGVKSTALLEACCTLKPVIRQLYGIDGEYDQIQLECGGIYLANTKFEFIRIMEQLLSSEIPHQKILQQQKIRDDFFVKPQINSLLELIS